MKKYLGIIAALLLAFSMLSMTALASETCDYAKDGETCEVWWFYDSDYHWRACLTHEDWYGDDIPVSEPEEHNFEGGVCTVCEWKETSLSSRTGYIIVFAVIAIGGSLVCGWYKKNELNFKVNATFLK